MMWMQHANDSPQRRKSAVWNRIRIPVFNQRLAIGHLWKLRNSLLAVAGSRLKIGNYLRSRLAISFRRNDIRYIPPSLMVEVSSRCNLACTVCPRQFTGGSRPEGDMDLAQFQTLVDEVGDRAILLCLWYFGEPLLNPDLASMIAYAKDAGLLVMVTTNGLALHGETAKQLLSSQPDYLVISFDGTSKEAYKAIRGADCYDHVEANILAFIRLKRERRAELPLVDLHCLITQDNEAEFAEAANRLRSLGTDLVSFKSLDFGNNPEVATRLPDDITLRRTSPTDAAATFVCRRPWTSSVIAWNGDVFPCCRDTTFRSRFGNAFDEGGFEGVWNSAAYCAFRRQTAVDFRKIPLCRNCYNADFDTEQFIDVPDDRRSR